LARRGPRQLGQHGDPAGPLVGLEAVPGEGFELARDVAGGTRLAEHDEGVRLDEAGRVPASHDGALENGRVLRQGRLELDRGEPDSSDLQHVVAAAGMPEVAVLVLAVAVARADPVPAHRAAGGLGFLPVEGHRRIAAYQEIAGLARLDVPVALYDPY